MNQYLRRKIWTLNRSGKFRGYLRTVSGYPVTLTDCMAGQPVSLAVDGNAVQDGTPTPDNPVDVQLCGDRTVNLFDVSELTDTHGGYVENGDIYVIDYPYVTDITPEKFLEMTGLQEGDEFTTTANYKRLVAPNSNNGAEYITFMPSSSGFNSMNLFNPNGLFNSIIPVGFNSSNYRPLYIYGGSTGTGSDSPRAVWSNLAIYKGSYTAETMPAYEPHGYKVSLAMTGINLLSNNENDWVGDAGIYKHFKIPVEGTTTLQVKIKEGKSIPKDLYLGYSKNGMNATGGITWLIANGIFNGAPIRTSELKYISIHPKTALLDEIFDSLDIMLIEGAYTTETMPAYEPYQPPQDFAVYLPEQIAKVGDVADEVVVDMENRTAELKKNVGSVVADGDEHWAKLLNAYDTADYTNRCSIFGDIYGNYQTPGYFSNRFERKLDIMWINPNSEAFNINGDQLHLSISNTRLGITADDEATDRTTKFKAWLNDNNVTVYAPLAEPVTTDITSLQQWDAMPSLWSGTAVITADTVIAPSAITAKYYASKPEEVN